MSTKVQLTGGAFQDVEGNPLALGYLTMVLSQDAQVNGGTQIGSGIEVKIALDSSGNVVTSPAQYVWPNDVLTPINTFYTVSAYKADGQLAWGPNYQQVFSTPSPFNVGAWVPSEINVQTEPFTTYDVGTYIPGQPFSAAVVNFLAIERVVRFAANFVPSTAVCGTAPTAVATFVINQNGTEIGNIAMQTDGTAVFSSAGAVFNPGDVLSIVAPTSVDATMQNIGIILSGNTTG